MPVSVAREDIVTYTIRVYNEGEKKDGYVKRNYRPFTTSIRIFSK